MPARTTTVLTKRNLLLAVGVGWAILTVVVATAPYDPMAWDLADATTNYIWTREYARGVYDIPYAEWQYPPTQSSVVWHNGEYVVVNEKGPGHALMLVPFHILGAEALFGPLLAGLAVLSTYLLANRLFGWRVGLIAAVAVLVNLSVLIMWHRFYWTDASTMHLLVASVALLVEALHRANGRSLDPRSTAATTRRDTAVVLLLSFLGGLALGGSISTRYPVALVAVAIFAFLLLFGLTRAWPSLRRRRLAAAVHSLRPLVLVLPFLLGLVLILVPLMKYNTTYFGGPLNSGYDATPLNRFNASTTLDPRNQSTSWLSSPLEGLGNALRNAVVLAPILLFRMPLLALVPFALWFLRRRLSLALLLPWIVIALYTYLSLGWVVQYARADIAWRIAWEPRYFMPALPPIAILGAWVVDRVAMSDRLFRVLKVPRSAWKSLVVAGLLLLPVLAFGIGPAAANFRNPAAVGGPPGPGPPEGIPVTTDQLTAAPQDYDGRFVRLDGAVVVQPTPQGAVVQSPASSTTVEVRLFNWPANARPSLTPGTVVDVRGRFTVGPPGTFFVGVAWGTSDYLRTVP